MIAIAPATPADSLRPIEREAIAQASSKTTPLAISQVRVRC